MNTEFNLRKLLQRGAGIVLPGAGNAITARVIEECGYKAVFVSGAGIANSYLGVPDLGLISLTEFTSHVGAIREAVNLPIIADADTGFGNALNVQRTVRLLEAAGANVAQIEDQVFPKRCGHFDGKEIISTQEMISKIKAAADARRSDDFLILARTDAIAVEGYQGAVDRANAYVEAGADMLFVEAPRSAEELAAIPRDIPAVHICNMVFGGRTPLLSASELGEMGYAGILYANVALQAGLLAMKNVLEHLGAQGSVSGIEHMIMPFADRQRMVNYAQYEETENRYAIP